MSNSQVTLGTRDIGQDQPPLVVAELSANHNRSLDLALRLIDAAADAGAEAVKLQTYTPDTMTIAADHGDFHIDDPNSLWHGRSLHELYQEAYTPWEWHAPLFERCHERGLMAFSTPFDESAVDFLEQFDPPCYKVASFEAVDLPLLRHIAATGRPVIMSTGMATLGEIDEAVRTLREGGCPGIVLLQCTSAYPAPPDTINLATIPHMRALFDTPVGLSDHTLGIGVSIASVALGASLIERHVTLDRGAGGPDAAFSLEPPELAALITESQRAWQALGQVHYGPQQAEATSLSHRRSLYLVRDIKAGETLTADHIRRIRPGGGLPPRDYDRVLGMTVTRDSRAGTPLDWTLLKP